MGLGSDASAVSDLVKSDLFTTDLSHCHVVLDHIQNHTESCDMNENDQIHVVSCLHSCTR